MDKDQEIRNMLEYIAGHFHDVRKRDEGVFEVENMFDLSTLSTVRDYSFCTLNFNTKTIEIYSYDESHHNGDHYNCVNSKLDWDQLSTGYDSLKNRVLRLVQNEIREQLRLKMVEDRVQEILKGQG